MPIEHLIFWFGCLDLILVLAAFMAHPGYLSLPLVIAVAFLVTLVSGQFLFWIGRTRGNQLLEETRLETGRREGANARAR